MTGRDKIFYNTMNTMEDGAIIDSMRQTWNDPEGEIFREFGFEILESRHSEEFVDDIYEMLYFECEA